MIQIPLGTHHPDEGQGRQQTVLQNGMELGTALAAKLGQAADGQILNGAHFFKLFFLLFRIGGHTVQAENVDPAADGIGQPEIGEGDLCPGVEDPGDGKGAAGMRGKGTNWAASGIE